MTSRHRQGAGGQGSKGARENPPCPPAPLRLCSFTPLLLAMTLSLALDHMPVSAQPYKQIRGIIHIDSTISGGEYDPEQMVRALIEHDLEVAIFTDQATTRTKYGIFPARGLLEIITGWYVPRHFGRESSVATAGPDNYLTLLNNLDRKYKNISIIPGVEVFPFYYWQENFLQGELTLVNGYKHLLAIGLENPQDYIDMPTIGEGFFREYGIQTLFSLWPLALLFIGYKCIRQARRSIRPQLYKIPAMVFFVVGFLFLLNNFPYKYGRYDAYGGDMGYAPYQDFIDYVENRGGMVFWAHPEVSSDQVYPLGPLEVSLKTKAPYNDLLHLHNYTGFAAFFEGMKYIIPPGGIWDQVLDQYCQGLRQRPIWAIAEGDVEGEGFDPRLSQTAFLVNQKNRQEILQSLQDGRIYALAGPHASELSLEEFEITHEGITAISGQLIETSALNLTAKITIKTEEKYNALSAELIKDGVVIETFRGNGVLDIAFSDSLQNADRMHYYRIDVRAHNQTRLLSNPIFVRIPSS